jgi:transcriptional regulator with XRE-family HTH domain
MQGLPQREDVYAAMSGWEGLDNVERALRLRAALKRAGLSQSDLMRLLDVSQTIISRWANARGELAWPRWLSICQITDVGMDWVPPVDLLHDVWAEWKEDYEKRVRPGDPKFDVPEPPKKKRP